ncbi:MAG: S-methyl-5'-thioadenosine phosphorylase [Nocardioides sp.]
MSAHADVAVIGGSGFYSFLEDPHELALSTPYGEPSAPIAVGEVAGRSVAFLPRHGRGHEYPPHRINYRANLWALRSLGVRQVLSPCAVGGLRDEVAPGDLVVPDQLVDRTSGRDRTFVEHGAVHLPFADPYCPRLSTALGGLEGVSSGGTMVVIDGPRFSTRAESQDYAGRGWTLINMTAAPEAALARELTDVPGGDRPGHRHGRGRRGRGRRPSGGRVRALRAQHRPAQEPAGRRHRRPSEPRRLLVRHLGRRARPALRAAGGRRVKVVLTGSAGFIGTAVAAALADAGDEVVGVDVMLPQAHADAEPPDGTLRLDVRDAASWTHVLRGADVVVHQAALVGLGADVADLPSYAGHNDLGTAALLAAMHEAGVDSLVLASSMVVYGEGRYVCPTHGAQVPAARSRQDLEAGRFENPCPVCAEPLGWDLVDETAPVDPRSAYAASKLAQEHFAAAWARQTGGRAVALRYHNVYGPGMPQDTPYSGVAAMFRSSVERGEPPQVYEDGGQMRDFVHVSDVARANVLAARAVAGSPTGLTAYNVCSGTPVSILEVARAVSGEGPEPVVTGGFRLGDVRHVVASPARAARELGFHADVTPEAGLAAFRHDPLRPAAATSSSAPGAAPGAR